MNPRKTRGFMLQQIFPEHHLHVSFLTTLMFFTQKRCAACCRLSSNWVFIFIPKVSILQADEERH